ncbi:origin of replication complex subunit 1B-like [Tripterygium wilfordii]|uniref:Origin recognition complex subunit 1 n=1 Tax=Tripterygium wilfordii TaxID=458696 RepID=A0A7J7D2M8_TRIWF|nr:origin of replication complex subunit 1B-like [Tripterygium wilfordii]
MTSQWKIWYWMRFCSHLCHRSNRRLGREKRVEERKVLTRQMVAKNLESGNKSKKRVYYKKVVYDGVEFEVGDDVYVKKREGASSDDEDPDIEECRVCFMAGKTLMIECDECLGGFHLKCLKPPLKDVPEGEWICTFCEARKLGKAIEFPRPPEGKKLVRTLREKLLSSDMWAAHVESLWKEADGSYWSQVRWYMIPEETAVGRQPHNLKRELYRTNDFTDIEMESIIRHCYVKNVEEYATASNEGDDVFLCEYEYDIRWQSFKRLAEIDNGEEDGEGSDGDKDWNSYKDAISDTDEEMEYEEENMKVLRTRRSSSHVLAANLRKGQFFGLQKIGSKKIPEHVRCCKKKPHFCWQLCPSRYLVEISTEMEDITSFIKGAICDDQCLGRCLYIHGVPGTGKTMSVHAVMRSLRVGRKKALHLLNERFSEGKKFGKEGDRPCILLIDELDLLVTRNQSVLYNILDWPTKPHSKLIVIAIANTMDLPEKLLPRISSRMGLHRLCFGPYNYQQLQEIILSRLNGIDAFEKAAIEFASRKVGPLNTLTIQTVTVFFLRGDWVTKLLYLNTFSEKCIVGMSEVEAAIQEMFQAPHIQVMKSCSKMSKVFLTAMVHELYKTGMGETTFEKLAMTISCICTSNGQAFPAVNLVNVELFYVNLELVTGCKNCSSISQVMMFLLH